MGKQSKNAVKAGSARSGGGKDHVKLIISEKNPVSGKYSYKEVIVHKDNVDEVLKGNA